MIKQRILGVVLISLAGAQAVAVTGPSADAYPAWRAAAAGKLAERADAGSLATAAALTFLSLPARPKGETAKGASAALDLASRASELAANNPAISWLHLQLCTFVPGCDVRAAATTVRWVAADNSAAWMPTLAAAQRDRDSMEIDRVLASMAEGPYFNLYANRTTVLMFDALKRVRSHLPANYLPSDLARLNEAMDLAQAVVLPSFSPLINACRDGNASAARRDDCLVLSRLMQRSDTVMAQAVGFALEKRLTPPDAKQAHGIAERRRLLEWRVAAAEQANDPVLPWLKNVRARSRIAKMRAQAREEDVAIALLREYKIPLDLPEEHK